MLAATSALTGAAQAQSTDDLVDRAESRLDKVVEPSAGKVVALDGNAAPWTLSFDLPVTYNTNVANAQHGKTGSVHGNPSVSLARDFSVGGNATLSIEAGADGDVYLVDDVYDSSTLYGAARLTLGDPEAKIAPYVDYTALGIFDGVFEDHVVTLHHFTVGASRALPLSEHANLSVDANITRREASVREVELTRGALTAKYRFKGDDGASWVFALRGQYSDYTGGAMSSRKDKLVRASIAVRQKLAPQLAVTFQAKVDRNWSNRSGKDYAAWDFGPSVNFSTQF